MSTIGERLKEERTRLGYNQSDFGTIGGVQKRAQINYENNSRKPDTGYLEKVEKIGVDILYVITGTRTLKEEITPRTKAIVEMIESLEDSQKQKIYSVIEDEKRINEIKRQVNQLLSERKMV